MSAAETSNATSTNATSTNATAAEDVFFPPAPSPPPPGNITDPEVVWCLVNSTTQPHGWVHSPPPAPPGGYEPPSPIAPPLPPYATPASPPPPPAPPDLTLNLTYPPSPPPPMYLVWQPCEDAAAAPPKDTALFGLFDYADATHQLYAALLVLAFFFACFRARARRLLRRLSRRRRALSFEQAVKRHASLSKVKAVFDDMEARHKAETGDYDSDDSAYYRVKVLGIADSEKDREKSVKEEKALEKAIQNLRRKKRRRKKTWREYLAGRAAVWRGRFAAVAVVASYLRRHAGRACRRRAERDGDSDSDSDSDGDSDGDGDEKAVDGDETGKNGGKKRKEEETFSSSSSDEEDGDARRDVDVDGDTKEFQEMFHLTGQSEWEERFMSLVDIDGNGNIDFKEFTVGMGILGAPPDPYLASFDPPKTKTVSKTEDPEERTHADVLKFCANSPRFVDFVFQLLDVGGSGLVSRHEIFSVTWRFARYVETKILREFRRDLRKDRRRRRHALSLAAREAAERAMLEELEELETTTSETTTSYGYGSSWDSEYDSEYDSESSASTPGRASSDDKNATNPRGGGSVGGGSSRGARGDRSTTDAGSEADEAALKLERERRISAVVKGVAQTFVREEHDARFHAPAYAAYRPAKDVGAEERSGSGGAVARGADAVAEELDRLIAWHEAEALRETEASLASRGDASRNEREHEHEHEHEHASETAGDGTVAKNFAAIRRAAVARRRATVANARALVADASAHLRKEHGVYLSPKAFRAFLARFPEPFAPALEMFRTFEHYLRPAADVVAAVPALRLDVLRARRSAQTWREEQEPEWFFVPPAPETKPRTELSDTKKLSNTLAQDARNSRAAEGTSLETILEADIDLELGRARREKPRDEKDPATLAEIARLGSASRSANAAFHAARASLRAARDSGAFRVSGVSVGSRASTREVLMDAAERRRNAITRVGGRDDKPAAADVADNTATMFFRLDGEERSGAPRRPGGPRALGRAHAVSLSAQMRVRDLGKLARSSPADAAAALAETSLKARVVALRMLAPADAAAVLAAMAPEARAEAEEGLDPETVGRARSIALEGASREEPSPSRDGKGPSTDDGRLVSSAARADADSGSRLVGFGTFAAQDSRRAALEVLDDSETYVYMGDVEGEGGWTRDDGTAATGGSDEFV